MSVAESVRGGLQSAAGYELRERRDGPGETMVEHWRAEVAR